MKIINDFEDLQEGMECEIRPLNTKLFEENGWQKVRLKYNPGFHIENGGIYNYAGYFYANYKIPWRKFTLFGDGDIIEGKFKYIEIPIKDLTQIRLK